MPVFPCLHRFLSILHLFISACFPLFARRQLHLLIGNITPFSLHTYLFISACLRRQLHLLIGDITPFSLHMFISACFSPVCGPPSCVCCSLGSTLASPYFTLPVFPLFFTTRPMSSSSSDEDEDGYTIIKAHYFRGRSFWTWVKGAEFLTIPFTGIKIRCD